MRQSPPRPTDHLQLGLFWILVGLFFVCFSRDIPQASFTSEGDPGPRAFPVTLGLVLLAGGVAHLAGLGRTAITPETSTPSDQPIRPFNAVVVLLSVGSYIPLMNWIGFTVSTLALAGGLLRLLGSRWWTALIVSLCLVVMVQLLFGYGFKVPLPTNHWGYTFPGGWLF